MTTFARPRCLFFVFSVLVPSVAFAHPGHDGGHDLTWDFVGEALHFLTSPTHLLPAVVVGAVAIFAWRKIRARRERE